MANVKIPTKKLLKEPDQFITFSGKLFQLINKYKNQLAIFAGIFLFIIFLIIGIKYYLNTSLDKAFFLLEQANAKYQETIKSMQDKKEKEKVLVEFSKDLQNIIEKYSRNSAGKYAGIIYADTCYEKGDYDNAIKYYKKALSDYNYSDNLMDLILNSIAYCYEAKKDFDKALEYFGKVANNSNSFVKDDSLFNLGRLYADKSDKNKSIDAFKKILSDNKLKDKSDFIYFDLIKEQVDMK